MIIPTNNITYPCCGVGVGTYISGWCNFIGTADKYLFINLSRCTDTIHTMHELMHQSFDRFEEDIQMEEEIITWAEEEAYKVYK
jgi:hypothetical protein